MLRENILVFKDTDLPSNSNGNTKCYCDSNNLDYYHEIEKYKSRLKDSHNISSKLELEIADIKDRYKKDVLKLNDEITRQKEKYERLHESHKRISRLNHDLEERILNLIDRFNGDKMEFDGNYRDLLSKYDSSQNFILELQNDCDRYRNDCAIAVQLLQNNPNSFLSRHIETLPTSLKNRLNQFQNEIEMSHSFDMHANDHASRGIQFNHSTAASNSYIPITTFPPTPILFTDCALDKKRGPRSQNHVCASVLAEVLHPDKTAASRDTRGQSVKCTIELVCNKCGTVKEYRNASVQTVPHYLMENSLKREPHKNNQNLIFDV